MFIFNRKKRLLGGLLASLLLCFSLLVFSESGKAQIEIPQPKMKVLLVYDSLAKNTRQAKNVETLQALLTSFNVSTSTKAIDDYHSGDLSGYNGLIELINMSDLSIQNRSYLKDRDTTQLPKFHIGSNLSEEWQKELKQSLQLYQNENIKIDSDFFQACESIGDNSEVAVFPYKEQTKTFGKLSIENSDADFSYGILQDKIGYLPFFQSTGLSYLLTTQALSEWLGVGNIKRQYPLLVFSDFTPFSNLALLKKLDRKLANSGISYSISTTVPWKNTDKEAANQYLDALNEVSGNSTSFFIQTPYVQGNNHVDNNELQSGMTQSLDYFIKHKLYPVGVSTPSYWNQDRYYQDQALTFTDTVLLLPSPQSKVQQTVNNNNQNYRIAYMGVPLGAFDNVAWRDLGEKPFVNPTAIVVKMPEDEKQLEETLQQIIDKTYLFENTLYTDHQIKTSKYDMKINNQQIYLNGKRRWLETKIPHEVREKVAPKTSLSGFFAKQNQILTVFVSSVLVILSIFTLISFILYRRKYRR